MLVEQLNFLNEVNQKTEKQLALLFEIVNKLSPLKPDDGVYAKVEDIPGLIGELNRLITTSNLNHDSLARINDHLRGIV